MKKAGYFHSDAGLGNILYKKKKNGYQWYIIDYSDISNSKFPVNHIDILKRKIQLQYSYDIISILGAIINRRFSKAHRIKLKIIREDMKDTLNKLDPIPDGYLPKIINNENLEVITKFILQLLIHPKEVFKLAGIDTSDYHEVLLDKTKKILLLCIKHVTDKNYDKLLKEIKSF